MTVSNHYMAEERVSVLSSKASSPRCIVLFRVIHSLTHTCVLPLSVLTQQIHSSVAGTAFSHTEQLYMEMELLHHTFQFPYLVV